MKYYGKPGSERGPSAQEEIFLHLPKCDGISQCIIYILNVTTLWILFCEYCNFAVEYILLMSWYLPSWQNINLSPPSATCICQWIGPALVQQMACHLFGAKPLSKPILDIVSWTLRNKLQWNFYQNTSFSLWKCIWGCLRNGSHFVQGRWVNDVIVELSQFII